MAIVQIGNQSIKFGISNEEGGLTATTSVQMSRKREKKEARNKDGEIVTVVFLNPMTELTVEGYGDAGDLGAALSISTFQFTGTAYIEEVTNSASNEDFVKTTIKAVAYDNIN